MFLIFLIALGVLILFKSNQRNSSRPASAPAASQSEIANSSNPHPNPAPAPSVSGFQSPLYRAGERVTKKPFGIFIAPQTSPVQPERFRGYHTGADFEIFPEESNIDVPVQTVCSGKLLVKKYATGYGGVAAEACELNGHPITVVYGHLKLASIAAKAGDSLKAGDTLGILGAAYSSETNGERKHLHLGFHQGAAVNILGYVQNKTDLSGWIDPCAYVCHN